MTPRNSSGAPAVGAFATATEWGKNGEADGCAADSTAANRANPTRAQQRRDIRVRGDMAEARS